MWFHKEWLNHRLKSTRKRNTKNQSQTETFDSFVDYIFSRRSRINEINWLETFCPTEAANETRFAFCDLLFFGFAWSLKMNDTMESLSSRHFSCAYHFDASTWNAHNDDSPDGRNMCRQWLSIFFLSLSRARSLGRRWPRISFFNHRVESMDDAFINYKMDNGWTLFSLISRFVGLCWQRATAVAITK